MKELLALRNVTKRFGGLTALDGVNLEIRAGEIVGLIGPNGAGKSTLVGVVTGFVPPTAGRVYFKGVDITGWPPYRIARLGLRRTFQGANAFRGLSLEENILLGAAGAPWTADLRLEARSMLSRMGLNPEAEPSAFTAGQLRLLAVGRALMARPELLLLDEPAAGLSEPEVELLRSLILDAHRRGTTLLVIEHNVGFVFSLCQRILVLDLGRLIAEGPPVEVGKNPRVVEAYLGIGWGEMSGWRT